MLVPCLHAGDAADMWKHSKLTQGFTQESQAKSDLYYMWRTYDGSKLICHAWLKREHDGSNKGRVGYCCSPFVSRFSMWTHDGCSCCDLCCCCRGFGRRNSCFIVKAFTDCWSSYFNLQVGGLSKNNFLFFERKCLNTYLIVEILDMFFACGDSRNRKVSGIISV